MVFAKKCCNYVSLPACICSCCTFGWEIYTNDDNKMLVDPQVDLNRAGLKDRQTRQLPRAPKPEGPQGFDSKAKFY